MLCWQNLPEICALRCRGSIHRKKPCLGTASRPPKGRAWEEKPFVGRSALLVVVHHEAALKGCWEPAGHRRLLDAVGYKSRCWRCCLCCRRVLRLCDWRTLQEELIRTRDGTAPPPVCFQHGQGMKGYHAPADKGEILTVSRYQRSHSSVRSGTQEQYIDNDYSPALWLTQLPYTLFCTYELVYNRETTLPNEIQLSFYR